MSGPKCDLHPNEEGVDGKHGAVAVDGVENCVREVRRQIGAGADWIKVSDAKAHQRETLTFYILMLPPGTKIYAGQSLFWLLSVRF